MQAQIDIGRLETEVTHLTKLIDELKLSNAAINQNLNTIQRTLDEARGGWRTLMWIGGASATLGSLFTWALTHVNVKV